MYSRTENLCQSQEKRGGGTVDSELSTDSENPVQNKLITAKLNELDSLIEQTRQLKASLEQYGMVKLSDSSAVTDSTGLALPATEKNASIEGTLANQIATGGIDENLKPILNHVVPEFSRYLHDENTKILYVSFRLKEYEYVHNAYDCDIVFKIIGTTDYSRNLMFDETVHINTYYNSCYVMGFKNSEIPEFYAPKILIFKQNEKTYVLLAQKFIYGYNFASVSVPPHTYNFSMSGWDSYSNIYHMPLELLTERMWYEDGEQIGNGWTVNFDNPISGIPGGEQIFLKEGTFVPTKFL